MMDAVGDLNSLDRNKRGQLSIEFLLIFAIFLSILSLFLMNFIKINNKFQIEINKILLSKYSNDLENSINSLCILGDGNERILYLYFPEEVKISANKNELILSSNLENKSFFSKCTIDITSEITIKKGFIKIESKNGKITLVNQ
ncbi:MAG: class III signal peptide-containing protein [Candidatus Aenigmatarchaeota archaeon]